MVLVLMGQGSLMGWNPSEFPVNLPLFQFGLLLVDMIACIRVSHQLLSLFLGAITAIHVLTDDLWFLICLNLIGFDISDCPFLILSSVMWDNCESQFVTVFISKEESLPSNVSWSDPRDVGWFSHAVQCRVS